VRAVRDAVGDGVRIMIDRNERLDLPTALWAGAQLANLGIYWLEEPLRSDDVVGHATLAAAQPTAVAVGEHLHGRFEFAAYLRAGAATVLQPDVPLSGRRHGPVTACSGPRRVGQSARRLDDAGLCQAVRSLSPPTPR
jgi:L-alanine-DL-glutamate epimerase-like enolase superfamily enzyme